MGRRRDGGVGLYPHGAGVFYRRLLGARTLNWLVGIVLLLGTLMLSFTGYLLPWDQLAYRAITVETSIAGEAPVLGPRGNTSCWAATLSVNRRCCAFMCCTFSSCRCWSGRCSPTICGACARTVGWPRSSRCARCARHSPRRRRDPRATRCSELRPDLRSRCSVDGSGGTRPGILFAEPDVPDRAGIPGRTQRHLAIVDFLQRAAGRAG